MYIHIRDQNDNAMYVLTRWVPTIRHFLTCEDVAGGSQQSGGENIIFQGKKDAVACMRPWAWCLPPVSLSHTVIFQLLSFVDHFDHTMLSAPRPVDNGEAPDWNDPEMGKTGQWSRRWRGVGNLTGSGARQHSRSAAHGRQEQE